MSGFAPHRTLSFQSRESALQWMNAKPRWQAHQNQHESLSDERTRTSTRRSVTSASQSDTTLSTHAGVFRSPLLRSTCGAGEAALAHPCARGIRASLPSRLGRGQPPSSGGFRNPTLRRRIAFSPTARRPLPRRRMAPSASAVVSNRSRALPQSFSGSSIWNTVTAAARSSATGRIGCGAERTRSSLGKHSPERTSFPQAQMQRRGVRSETNPRRWHRPNRAGTHWWLLINGC
jgi:hypothetical protein